MGIHNIGRAVLVKISLQDEFLDPFFLESLNSIWTPLHREESVQCHLERFLVLVGELSLILVYIYFFTANLCTYIVFIW